MLAIHDKFTPQMRNRLKTTGIGLGLVRLLQDARRFDEARTTLYSLENGFQGVEQRPDEAGQKAGSASCSAEVIGTEVAEMPTLRSSLA